jgi:hypothetical protein
MSTQYTKLGFLTPLDLKLEGFSHTEYTTTKIATTQPHPHLIYVF